MSAPILYDANNRPITASRARSRMGSQAKALMAGFKGANDQNLSEWIHQPVEINAILRNDLFKLRARSRDLAMNDDTARRFLFLLKQNVLGHAGIKLQAKNKLRTGKKPDTSWNQQIETEWPLFSQKRRRRGRFESPSACGQFSLREIAWLSLWSRAIDGECFVHILHGYPHNRHRFAVRFFNPDLLDSGFCIECKNGNRIEMGIEFDKYDRPVAYHFNEAHPNKKFTSKARQKRQRIPASQIIHIFRHEYVGQIRGIPDFAAIMHKAKMLNGVHEAIVVGWRVAAAKMGFFTSSEPEDFSDDWNDDDGAVAPADRLGRNVMDATPGTLDIIPKGFDLKLFDPDYPTSTYESGHKVFMQQLSNGLNVSSPSLSNNYENVNYSSLRQALLEDREGWRCIQAEMIDGFYQPLFDEWYDWTVNITGRISLTPAKQALDPAIVWQPRGFPWVDPLKEVNAQIKANQARLKTKTDIIAETSGADFIDTADTLQEEQQELLDRDLLYTVEEKVSLRRQHETSDKNKFQVGNIVSRIGTDEQEVLDIGFAGDSFLVRCIKEPHDGFCSVGDEEWNLPRRYEFVRKSK